MTIAIPIVDLLCCSLGFPLLSLSIIYYPIPLSSPHCSKPLNPLHIYPSSSLPSPSLSSPPLIPLTSQSKQPPLTTDQATPPLPNPANSRSENGLCPLPLHSKPLRRRSQQPLHEPSPALHRRRRSSATTVSESQSRERH